MEAVEWITIVQFRVFFVKFLGNLGGSADGSWGFLRGQSPYAATVIRCACAMYATCSILYASVQHIRSSYYFIGHMLEQLWEEVMTVSRSQPSTVNFCLVPKLADLTLGSEATGESSAHDALSARNPAPPSPSDLQQSVG